MPTAGWCTHVQGYNAQARLHRVAGHHRRRAVETDGLAGVETAVQLACQLPRPAAEVDDVHAGLRPHQCEQVEERLPPLVADQSGVIFEEGARKLGYHPFSTPRAILSRNYQGRPGCSYCGFCQAFGCHIGAKSSILVTKLPEADATGNFKLLTGTMVYRVNSDNSGRATGVSYWGVDGSDNRIDAELVILAPFIYDNTRLLLLSKNGRFPNGLANSSGHVGKHLMAHIGARVFVAFDDRFVNIYMGPSAQKHSLDDFNADNFDHSGQGFMRGAQISVCGRV